MATSYSGDAMLTQHHPRIVTTVSNAEEIYQSGNGGLRIFSALVCEKGKEDIQLISSPSELIAKTGEINASKYGQAANNVHRWLQSGGEALIMRVLPDNATFAHAFLDIQTKVVNEGKSALQVRKVITTSNANTDIGLLENELEDMKIPSTSDGYNHNIIALFAPKGRGKYYNNIGFRITSSKQFDNIMNSRLYNIEVVKFKNNNLINVIEGPFLVSFNPEALSPISQESIFIEDVLNKYSKELTCKVNVDNFIKLARLINEDAYPFVIDPIFGLSRVINGHSETLNGKDVHFNILKQDEEGNPKTDIYGDYIPNFVDETVNENTNALNYQNKINESQKVYTDIYLEEMKAAIRDISNENENLFITNLQKACADENFSDEDINKSVENLMKAVGYADLVLSDRDMKIVYDKLNNIKKVSSKRIVEETNAKIALEKLDSILLGLQETATLITVSGQETEKIDRYALLYNDLVTLAKDTGIDISDYTEDIKDLITNIKDIVSTNDDKINSMSKLLAPATKEGNETKSLYDLTTHLSEKINKVKTDAASLDSVKDSIKQTGIEIKNLASKHQEKPKDTDSRKKLEQRQSEFNSLITRNYAFSSNNIFRLNGGSEGDLEDKDGNINSRIANGLLVSAYSGSKNPTLMDKRVTVFNFILDANYPVEVKNAIANFAENVRRDFVFIADCKIQGDAEQTLAFRQKEFNVDSNLVALYGQAVLVYDEFTGRDRQFTMPYVLASKLPSLYSSVGLQYPIAGSKRGIISGFKSLNYLPNESYQEILYTNRINYAINDTKRTKLNSQLTSSYNRTPLSDLNNVITMLNIKREAEGIAEKYQFEFADKDVMRLLQQEMNESLNKYVTASAADSISCTVYASDYDLQNHVIRVTLSIKFKDIIETVLITLEVTR